MAELLAEANEDLAEDLLTLESFWVASVKQAPRSKKSFAILPEPTCGIFAFQKLVHLFKDYTDSPNSP